MSHKLKSVGEEKKIDESTRVPISVNMTDGSSEIFECGMSYSDNGEVRIKYIPYWLVVFWFEY